MLLGENAEEVKVINLSLDFAEAAAKLSDIFFAPQPTQTSGVRVSNKRRKRGRPKATEKSLAEYARVDLKTATESGIRDTNQFLFTSIKQERKSAENTLILALQGCIKYPLILYNPPKLAVMNDTLYLCTAS